MACKTETIRNKLDQINVRFEELVLRYDFCFPSFSLLGGSEVRTREGCARAGGNGEGRSSAQFFGCTSCNKRSTAARWVTMRYHGLPSVTIQVEPGEAGAEVSEEKELSCSMVVM